MKKFYQTWQEMKASGAPPPPTIVRRAGHPRGQALQTEYTTTHACPFKPCSPPSDTELVLDQLATSVCPFKL